jgi:glutamine---fructose-6-phosphate transaminase (isomerizing)
MTIIEQEIASQPEVLRTLLSAGSEKAAQIAKAIRDFNPAFVMIAARGTSDNAGRYAQYLLGIQAGLPVALATPSIHTLYEASPNLSRALIIGISQSGKAEDVRKVMTDGKAQGALTVSITNDENSPMAQSADYHLPLYAGEEVSVAATKTYTAQLTAIAMIGSALVGKLEMANELARLPEFATETLRRTGPIADWAERYRYMDRFATIGRGYNYCTAFEISLKVKELCYITGVEYSEADFRHGPIALVKPGFPVIVVAPQGKTAPLMIDLLEKLQKLEAECLVISNDEIALGHGKKTMPIPANVPEWLTPIVSVMPGQVFAMNLALAKGHAVDKPIGLTKVTITA